ncbi:formin-like protein 18 isoform X2 [Malania oleifera]|uniref:formin-like protein 18 isoform X2 n=1 Tax=Malania oleifera TaxID=397392 RepID=UPI0025ADF1C9|nr:formin-like protein 18 isoform X2 [Malania oleifera]
MVSDQQIAEALDSLLRDSNPNSFTSLNGVVQQLESKLGLDLSNKVDFIRTQIHLLFRSQPPPPQPQPQQPPQHHQHRPPKDHFAPHQTPNFPPSPSHLPPSFAVHPPPPAVLKPDPAAQNVAIATPEAPKQSAQGGTKRKGGPGGLNKLCGVSPALQAIVGQPALPRTEIVKQLWAYIRKNNLQDPSNKRKIICNDELRLVFETDCTDMFKMNKLLAKHIIPLEPSKQSGQQSKKIKVDVDPATKSTESGPVIISEALAKFVGTGGREMLESEAVRRIWEYIKVNHLEDPINPMVIVCDAKLQELLGCESISALGIHEMLARHHLFKRS